MKFNLKYIILLSIKPFYLIFLISSELIPTSEEILIPAIHGGMREPGAEPNPGLKIGRSHIYIINIHIFLVKIRFIYE